MNRQDMMHVAHTWVFACLLSGFRGGWMRSLERVSSRRTHHNQYTLALSEHRTGTTDCMFGCGVCTARLCLWQKQRARFSSVADFLVYAYKYIYIRLGFCGSHLQTPPFPASAPHTSRCAKFMRGNFQFAVNQ